MTAVIAWIGLAALLAAVTIPFTPKVATFISWAIQDRRELATLLANYPRNLYLAHRYQAKHARRARLVVPAVLAEAQ